MQFMHLIQNKCPRCHQGKVFPSSNLFSFRFETMHSECPVCHLNFMKEPGFYWGSMYASYALVIPEALMVYLICRLTGTGTFDFINLWIIIGVLLLLSPFNFRLARLIWLYIFPNS